MRQLISQATIKTALPDGLLKVREVRGSEGLSELFRFDVELEAPALVPVPFDELLGKPAAIRLAVSSGPDRFFHGIVGRVNRRVRSRIAASQNMAVYQLRVVPKIELLEHSLRSQVFQDQTVKDILQCFLANYNVQIKLESTYDPRPFCVQYRESDLAFLSRLMEEEGIFYFFRHTADNHQMIVGDSPTAFSTIDEAATLHFRRDRSVNWFDDRVWDWAVTHEMRSGKAALGEMHSEMCDVNPGGTAPLAEEVSCGRKQYSFAVAGNADLELYDYPARTTKLYDNIGSNGQVASKDAAKTTNATANRARLEMERQALAGFQVRCAGFCPYLRPGGLFELADHGQGDGDYYVGRVEHSLISNENQFAYENQFAAQPKAMPYRPPLRTARPSIAGVLTALVTGPKKSDVFTDPFGRVRVQFYWDRTGATGLTSESGTTLAGGNYWSDRLSGPATSSTWLRVSQPWAGESHGRIVVPRVGMEVAVGFLDGDPDQPVVLGTLYNSVNPPPYTLPADATASGLKTHTAGGDGGTFSGLGFEDRSKSERVQLHSEAHLGVNAYANHVVNVAGQQITRASNVHGTVGAIPIPGGGSGGGGLGGVDTFNWTVGNVDATVGNSAKLYYGQYVKAICGLYGRYIWGSKIDLIIDPLSCLSQLGALSGPLASVMMSPWSPLGRNEVFMGDKLEYVFLEKSSVILGAKLEAHLKPSVPADKVAYYCMVALCKALAALMIAQFVLYAVKGDSYSEWENILLEYAPFGLAAGMILISARIIRKTTTLPKLAQMAEVAVIARNTAAFADVTTVAAGVVALT